MVSSAHSLEGMALTSFAPFQQEDFWEQYNLNPLSCLRIPNVLYISEHILNFPPATQRNRAGSSPISCALPMPWCHISSLLGCPPRREDRFIKVLQVRNRKFTQGLMLRVTHDLKLVLLGQTPSSLGYNVPPPQSVSPLFPLPVQRNSCSPEDLA